MILKYDYSREITKTLLSRSFSVFPLNNFIQGIIDCALCEHCVVIRHMVSAVVVMLISAVVAAVGFVPDVRKLCHGGGLLLVELFNEPWVDRSAVSVDSALVNFQGIGN